MFTLLYHILQIKTTKNPANCWIFIYLRPRFGVRFLRRRPVNPRPDTSEPINPSDDASPVLGNSLGLGVSFGCFGTGL